MSIVMATARFVALLPL